ncbi:U3 small nucleolar RNA-associated protein 25 homolog isoform X2 [Phascolarctos cinereus]
MGKRRNRSRSQSRVLNSLSKKQKKHLRDFGEEHPFYDRVSGKEAKPQICKLSENSDHSSSESDSDSESEKISEYHKLLATLKNVSEEEDEEEEESAVEEEVEVDSEEDHSDSSLEKEEEEEEEGEEEQEGKRGGKEADVAPSDAEDKDGEVLSQQRAAEDEFTDIKHESEFSLETNFLEEEGGDHKALQKDGDSAVKASEDPFLQHMNKELKEKDIQAVSTNPKITQQLNWSTLGQLVFSTQFQTLETFKPPRDVDLMMLHLQKPLDSTWPKINSQFLSGPPKPNGPFSPLQKELFSIMNSYRDLLYPERTALGNGEEIRHVYCLHAMNHVLKANSQVLSNNSKRRDKKPRAGDDDDAFRDQGLTRPKVLIVVPFREAALRVVQLFISLLEAGSKKKIDVSNKKRFKGEYGCDPDERPPNLKRPEDYDAVFAGNIDDHFRMGVAVLQRSIRLYAPFYSSDILIASPLGLRTIIGAEGEKKRDFDFLSSIEILIIDQVDIYLMQNWEHVLHLMNHMNLLPLDSHGVDFSRVRMWSLNNRSKYYRQTLLFGALQEAQINSVFSKYCVNYQGQIAVRSIPMTGSISQVLVQLPHVFQRLEAENFLSVIDARYTIKGIRNLIFYELPTYPHFYSEVCNMLKATGGGEEATWTCTVLYSKYDAQRLAAVVGVERAAQMLQSKKNVHLFITGEK